MTYLYLLNVPFDNSYKNTIYFKTPDDQLEYMDAHSVPKLAYDDFSYQRKDNIIRIPAHIDTLYKANYVCYRNPSSPEKWFYAFIVDMKYVNEERTDIQIETDVIQTWMFDYTVKESFIEREHCSDDTFGIHTIPEQLETGEYKCTGYFHKETLRKTGIVVASTINLADAVEFIFDPSMDDAEPEMFGGIYSGVRYYYFDTAKDLNKCLSKVDTNAKAEGIQAVFMCPRQLLRRMGGENNDEYYVSVVVGGSQPQRIEWNGPDSFNDDLKPWMPHNIDGHDVRNNKLFTQSYNYLLATNNAGSSNVYAYELFANGEPDFVIYSTVTPGMSIKLIPKNYGGLGENFNESLTMGKTPICNWTSDVFTNWLTQQAVNIAVDASSSINNLVKGVGSVIGGAYTGNVGLISSGASSIDSSGTQIGHLVGQIYQHSLIPPASKGNINSGDVIFSCGMNTFSLYQMCIRKEYAEIIDGYFDMYGYKVNKVKVPEVDHRPYYWYTKTVDANIVGAIPNTDLEKIRRCYDNGITFWRANADVGVYHSETQNNSIRPKEN